MAVDDLVESVRRLYHTVGLGACRDVLAVFGQESPGSDAGWVVRDLIDSGQVHPARDVVALDLFGGVPPHFEVIGVEPEDWRQDGSGRVLVVTGHFRTRPRGGWDVIRLPFAHVWRFGDEGVESVVSYLDGVEVRRTRSGRRGGRAGVAWRRGTGRGR